MSDDPSYGVIDPRLVYSVQAAARAMGQSARWVTDNLLDTDAVPYRKQGDFKGIPGWCLIAWVEADLRTKSEWREEVAEGRPRINTQSASIR